MRKYTFLSTAAALVLFAGCATSPANPRISMRGEKGWEFAEVDSLVAKAGSGDVAIVTLGNTAWVSHHVAVVRTEERPHYHRFHDLTVSMLKGEGILNVERRRIPMKAGDVAHVQRGTPHFFRNTGKGPAVAFVVFSPPFDSRDVVSAEEKEGEKPAAEPRKKRSWWPF